jgi:hypothetical protein
VEGVPAETCEGDGIAASGGANCEVDG